MIKNKNLKNEQTGLNIEQLLKNLSSVCQDIINAIETLNTVSDKIADLAEQEKTIRSSIDILNSRKKAIFEEINSILELKNENENQNEKSEELIKKIIDDYEQIYKRDSSPVDPVWPRKLPMFPPKNWNIVYQNK